VNESADDFHSNAPHSEHQRRPGEPKTLKNKRLEVGSAAEDLHYSGTFSTSQFLKNVRILLPELIGINQ